MTLIQPSGPVEILILGAGWTSTFLIPLLDEHNVSHAETTTTGRDKTIPFVFDAASDSTAPYERLPPAKTVLITFPLKGTGQSRKITSLYRAVHGDENKWIQLGSTGVFTGQHWNTSSSPYDTNNPRAIAEDELMEAVGGCILNLAGLYGGTRDPRNWVTRVAKSKEDVARKQALHLIHGQDVARAILAKHQKFTPAKRWIIADLHVYDWWNLFQAWGPEVRKRTAARIAGDKQEELGKREAERIGREEAGKFEFEKWVGELMVEEDVRALPRDPEKLGRVLDSREFWSRSGIWPVRSLGNHRCYEE